MGLWATLYADFPKGEMPHAAYARIFAEFFLTAGILAPLVLFLLLLQGRQQQRQAQVDAPASGVPIALPGPDDALTCLAVVRTETEDWFLLLRLDAYNNTVTSLGLPGQTAVRSPEGAP